MWESSIECSHKPLVGMQSKQKEGNKIKKKTPEPGREALTSYTVPPVPSTGKAWYDANHKGEIFEGPISVLTEQTQKAGLGGKELRNEIPLSTTKGSKKIDNWCISCHGIS